MAREICHVGEKSPEKEERRHRIRRKENVEKLPHHTLEDERERRLEWFTFVTHVPADYFEGEAI